MQHDLDKGHLNEEQKSYFETHAVWLCARREDVGKRNGRKLAHLAEDEQRFLHQLYTEHEETKYMNKHANTHIDFSTEKHDEIKKDQEASSPLEIHMCWNVLNDDKMDPPIHTEYLRSGGATTLILIVEGTRALSSLVMRSPIAANLKDEVTMDGVGGWFCKVSCQNLRHGKYR